MADKKQKKAVRIDDYVNQLSSEMPFSLPLEQDLDEQARKKEFLTAYQENRNLSKARLRSGVSGPLFRSWLEADLNFKDQYNDVVDGVLDDTEQVFQDVAHDPQAKAGDRLKAAAAYLQAKRPETWRNNGEGGEGSKTLVQIIFDVKPDNPELEAGNRHVIDVKAKNAPPKD